MNLRIVNQSNDPCQRKIFFEARDISVEEIPEVKTTIYVNGESKYVRQLIKSYEIDARSGRSIVWFEAEV